MPVFEQLITELKKSLNDKLPGVAAQEIMAPSSRLNLLRQFRPNPNTKKGSVLVLLYPYNNLIYTVLMLRSEYDGVHSGQISFPGGRKEESDKNNAETALRETHEELGINPSFIKLLGELSPLYIPPSDFLVTPVVAYSNKRPHMQKDPVEVESIIEVPLAELLHENASLVEELIIRDTKVIAPCFKIGDNIIWGATAMIMSEFIELLKKLASTKNILTN